MTKLTGAQIRKAARDILETSTGGLKWSEIRTRIYEEHPETPYNTIQSTLQAFFKNDPGVTKVAKGTYILSKYASDPITDQSSDAETAGSIIAISDDSGEAVSISEQDFYEPLMVWLKDELEEINEGLVLGGNLFKSKWGTPDVIGVLRPRRSDLVQFHTQIISAEIKIDPHQPIIAFGQAVAYRLFSHKSYIVVPRSTHNDDLSRLEALSLITGIGLITFKPDKETPDFDLRVHALPSQPDMFYVNQIAKRINEYSSSDFERLF